MVDSSSQIDLNSIKKRLELLKKSVQQDANESLNSEKSEFVELEREWKDIESSLKEEDAKIEAICRNNINMVKNGMEPVRKILL